MIKLEYNYLNDTELNILLSLNNTIETYQQKYQQVKIGISEEDPEMILKKLGKRGEYWGKLSILFKIKTLYMLNIIEFWLIDEHWDIYIDKHNSEKFDVIFKNEKYLYILMK